MLRGGGEEEEKHDVQVYVQVGLLYRVVHILRLTVVVDYNKYMFGIYIHLP